MNKTNTIIFIVVVLILLVLCSEKRREKIRSFFSENYEPQDMGSRRFWGYGREYGYALGTHDDTYGLCHETTPDDNCVSGFFKNIKNKKHYCCVNPSNY